MSVGEVSHGYLVQRGIIAQRGIEGKADVIPDGDVSCRATIIGQVRTLEITEVANVVDRIVAPGIEQRRIGRAGQRRAFGKQGIEDDAVARLSLAPYAEVAGEPVAQNVALGGVRLDGQPDGRGGPRVGRSPNAAAES